MKRWECGTASIVVGRGVREEADTALTLVRADVPGIDMLKQKKN
jgi:hypothetical protein